MLPLNSSRWDDLLGPGGMNARVLVQLIGKLQQSPSSRDWAEAFEQIAHQWSLGTTAYAALPHLVKLAVQQGVERDSDFLLNVGRVAAPIERYEPCPDDLKTEFDEAIQRARDIALSAAQQGGYDSQQYVSVLQAAAALSGRRGPGIQLIFTLGTTQPSAGFECPECGLDLVQEFTSDGCAFMLVDGRNIDLEQVPVTPNFPQPSLANSQDVDDFNWLANFCRVSSHDEVLKWLCLLYGNSHCPSCKAQFNVMAEVQRDVINESH